MADEHYESVKQQMKSQLNAGADKAAVMWAVVEGVTSIFDPGSSNVPGLVGGGLKSLYDSVKYKKSGGATLVPNPWFIANGHDEGKPDYTQRYLRNRGRKGLAGGGVALAGKAVAIATQADIAGIAQHGNATVSTSIHPVKLRAMAGNHRKTGTIRGWLDVLIRAKSMKAGIRGTQLVGSAIPVPAVGIITGIAAAAGKVGVTLTFSKIAAATAAEIHWRAFQEQAISGGLKLGAGAGVGPASRMLYELFTRRGATRVFGRYDVNRIIKEPAGWLAVYDKLMLV